MAVSVDEKRLAGPTVITTSNATLLTVPSGHIYVCKQFIICNTNGIDAWVTVALGTTATPGNAIFYRLPIAGYDTLVFDTALVLVAAEIIATISDQGLVNIIVTGWDHTL